MSRLRRVKPQKADAELDITAFLNLMIVLVPVLLLGMVFTKITVLDIQLPAGISESGAENNQSLELVVGTQGMQVNYPEGIRLKNIPLTEDGEQDYDTLSLVLQEVKRQLREKQIDKRDIRILSEPDVNYQTIISVVDHARSFKAAVVASVVDAELFPDISFGDAPLLAEAN